MSRFMLVYQVGIANVFKVDCFNLSNFGRNAKRIKQGNFRDCESFCLGIVAMGGVIHTAYCNQAGDIVDSKWQDDLSSTPFFNSMCPVYGNLTSSDID
jgi:hypothetical protein